MEDWKVELKNILEEGWCSDSKIEDFVDSHPEVRGKDIWNYVAELHAPECCKGCENVQLYPNMYPCTRCKRVVILEDMYEE